MSTPTLVTCPACGGYGEITVCPHNGGCSRINDDTYECRDCDGEGEVPADEPLPYWKPTDGAGTWRASDVPGPRTQLTMLGTVVVTFALVATFCGLVAVGQRLMCATHDNALRYCPGYIPQNPAVMR